MTSSSSSKTEFTCIFYDVFDVGGYAGSSLLEVSLLCLLSIPPLPLSNKLEFAQFGVLHFAEKTTEGNSKTKTAITSANELRIEQDQACWIEDDKNYPTATGRQGEYAN